MKGLVLLCFLALAHFCHGATVTQETVDHGGEVLVSSFAAGRGLSPSVDKRATAEQYPSAYRRESVSPGSPGGIVGAPETAEGRPGTTGQSGPPGGIVGSPETSEGRPGTTGQSGPPGNMPPPQREGKQLLLSSGLGYYGSRYPYYNGYRSYYGLSSLYYPRYRIVY